MIANAPFLMATGSQKTGKLIAVRHAPMAMLQVQAVVRVLVIVAVRLLQFFPFPKKDQAYLIRKGCFGIGLIDARH